MDRSSLEHSYIACVYQEILHLALYTHNYTLHICHLVHQKMLYLI